MIAIFILLSCVAFVRNKTLLINEYVCDDAINILAITEIWLKLGGDSAFITELTPDSYNFVHAPRQCGRGDGIGLLHRETYSCKLLASPCFKHIELLRARLMSPVNAPVRDFRQLQIEHFRNDIAYQCQQLLQRHPENTQQMVNDYDTGS